MLQCRNDCPAHVRDFRWVIPERFNIGTAIADDWAERQPGRVALFAYRPDGARVALNYGELARRWNALAAELARRGLRRGDRLALLMPQPSRRPSPTTPSTSSARSPCRLRWPRTSSARCESGCRRTNPRDLSFVDSVPLTATGKVIRRIFRDRARREAGLQIGRRLK
jgi:acyl-coenzyme A synthetase/AMP-(fatty) acid ligase